MPNRRKTNKRQVGLLLRIELCRKVEKGYGKPEDTSKAVAFERALEEATRKIELDPEDFRLIAEEQERNRHGKYARKDA